MDLVFIFFQSHIPIELECHVRLPVHWDKTVIVVMNEVRVCNPYLPENVSGGTPAANERVKKVVITCIMSFFWNTSSL